MIDGEYERGRFRLLVYKRGRRRLRCKLRKKGTYRVSAALKSCSNVGPRVGNPGIFERVFEATNKPGIPRDRPAFRPDNRQRQEVPVVTLEVLAKGLPAGRRIFPLLMRRE